MCAILPFSLWWRPLLKCWLVSTLLITSSLEVPVVLQLPPSSARHSSLLYHHAVIPTQLHAHHYSKHMLYKHTQNIYHYPTHAKRYMYSNWSGDYEIYMPPSTYQITCWWALDTDIFVPLFFHVWLYMYIRLCPYKSIRLQLNTFFRCALSHNFLLLCKAFYLLLHIWYIVGLTGVVGGLIIHPSRKLGPSHTLQFMILHVNHTTEKSIHQFLTVLWLRPFSVDWRSPDSPPHLPAPGRGHQSAAVSPVGSLSHLAIATAVDVSH